MAKTDDSLKQRMELKRLMDAGMSPKDAMLVIYPDNGNRSTYLKRWTKSGIYPFGTEGSPEAVPQDDNRQMAFVDMPKESQQAPVAVSHESLVEQIRNIVLEELSTQKITNKIEVVRPVLTRTKATSQMKSFRCPALLWELAESKAKQSNMSLNGVIESLLFQWLDRPEELLKK